MRIIGLISGTSVDGIDAALVEISGFIHDLKVTLLAGATYPYPPGLRQQILAVCGGASLSMAELATLDDAIAHQFAQAALTIQTGHPPAQLIGSHGQTVYHRSPQESGEGARGRGDGSRDGEKTKATQNPILETQSLKLSPHSPLGYSLQLGRGAVIAHLTGITTISNFRAADIAAGGQGAPMVPAIDVALLTHPTYNRCVQNIGGIGNVAYLPALSQNSGSQRQAAGGQAAGARSQESGVEKDRGNGGDRENFPSPSPIPVLGWDTGPGNVLLDLAVQHLSGGTKTYDQDGAWAATGTPCQFLVAQWLQQGFFHQRPPKSTGRELFGPEYLQQCLTDCENYSLSHADILASLTELTAASVADSYRRFLPQLPDQVLLCGGGSKNLYLRQRLQAHLESSSVFTTEDVGLNADFKEAIAFAVLAYWRYQEIPGNLPEVTGAKKAVLLGEIHQVSQATT
ncbi:MAG: anhydro-N-acetylmuramic acid kinase [Kovacikia sp.]